MHVIARDRFVQREPRKAEAWRADIDGLRAIAVLSVLIFHAFPIACPGGFLGVDVFFVISGFLITGILLKEHRNGDWSLLKFYERRARRIFPALSLVLGLTVVTTWMFAYPDIVRATGMHGVAGAFSVANVVLWKESGYFDLASGLKPLLHIWSLGVEEQFYIVWPILLAFLLRRSWLVGTTTLCICVLSLLLAEVFRPGNFNMVFYMPMFRAWELGCGALIALIIDKQWQVDRFLSYSLAEFVQLAGLSMIILSLFVLDSRSNAPGFVSLPAVLGAALVIWAGGHQEGVGRVGKYVLSNKFIVYIGAISYSLYLWHWPLLAVPIASGLELTVVDKLLLMIFAVFLSNLSLKWVETPMRHSRSPERAALFSTITLACVAVLSLGIYVGERIFPHEADSSSTMAWPQSTDSKKCPADVRKFAPSLGFCSVVRPLEEPTAVVWGDSHADHLFPGLAAVDNRRNWMIMGNSSCPPIIGVDVVTDATECRKRAELALNWIVQKREISTVVVAFFGYYFEDSDRAYQHMHGCGPSKMSISGSYEVRTKVRAFADGLEASIEKLVKADKRIIIVIDIPELPFNPQSCFMGQRIRIRNLQCFLSSDDVFKRQARLRYLIKRIAERYPSVSIVDPTQRLCSSAMCSIGTKSAPVYRDSHHLSLQGSAMVATEIVDALQSGN